MRKSSYVGRVLLCVVVLAAAAGCAGQTRLQAENRQLKEQVKRLSEALASGDSDAQRIADEKAALEEALAAATADVASRDDELETMRQKLAQQGFDVAVREGTVVVTLPTQILYPSGSAVLLTGGKGQLSKLSGELKGDFSDYLIEVQGHTDTDPIKLTKDKYKSNWELSYDRAQTVAYYLIDSAGIAPERVHVGAYGQYHPVASNSTREGKAKNRRVEIVAMRPSQ